MCVWQSTVILFLQHFFALQIESSLSTHTESDLPELGLLFPFFASSNSRGDRAVRCNAFKAEAAALGANKNRNRQSLLMLQHVLFQECFSHSLLSTGLPPSSR